MLGGDWEVCVDSQGEILLVRKEGERVAETIAFDPEYALGLFQEGALLAQRALHLRLQEEHPGLGVIEGGAA